MDADKATASSAAIVQNLDGAQALHLENQFGSSSGELSLETPIRESSEIKDYMPLGLDGNSLSEQLIDQELDKNALNPTNTTEESMDFHQEEPEKSTAGALVLQQAPAALVADSQADPCGPPFVSFGTFVKAPLPARTFPSNVEENSPQLGQFSSFEKFSNINIDKSLSKDFKQFSDYNFLIKEDNLKLSSELSSLNKSLQNGLPSFPSSPLKSQVFRFKPIQNSKPHDSFNFSQNVSISNGFLQANRNVSNPSLPLKPATTKTFAQAATPQTVTASIPTKGTSPDCGLLVERIKGSSLDDYAKIIETVSGKKTLVFIGQSPENQEKVMAFLEKPEFVDKLVSSGITVKGRWLCVSYLHQPATKLIVSDVLPFIPDELIIKACKTFGQPVYENLRRIPSSIRAKEYRHVLSFRRELLIVLEKDKQIPDHIVVFSHNNFYKLGITTPGLVCFNCKLQGHRAIFCKAPRSQTETLPKDDHNESIKTVPPGESSTFSSIVAHQVEGIKVLNSIMQRSKEKPDSISKETDFSPPDTIEENVPKLCHIGSVLHSPYYSGIKKSPSPKSTTWRVIGKKGKATPTLKTLSKLAQSPKTPKFDRFSDATWLRQYAPPRDATQSTDESPDEQSFDQDDPPPDININKRKKDKKIVSINVNDTTIKCNNVPQKQDSGSLPKPPLKQNTDPVFQPEEQASIAQLKKLILQFRQQPGKSKHVKKEIDLAQPIIEDLLQSVWSARTAKRRAILTDFKERHAQLTKYIDAIITLVPATSHGSQIYKTLSSIKQDIKNLSNTDGRKFRNQKP